MRNLQRSFQELLRYPSAVASLVIIVLLLAVSAYAMIAIPYNQALVLWRGGENIWYQLPKTVPPAWVNYFRSDKLPDTIILNSQKENKDVEKVIEKTPPGSKIDITYTFDYPYNKFPQELALYFTPKYSEKPPFASILWETPDGREIRVADFSVQENQVLRFSQDSKLKRRLGGVFPQEGLFADPDSVLVDYKNAIDNLDDFRRVLAD